MSSIFFLLWIKADLHRQCNFVPVKFQWISHNQQSRELNQPASAGSVLPSSAMSRHGRCPCRPSFRGTLSRRVEEAGGRSVPWASSHIRLCSAGSLTPSGMPLCCSHEILPMLEESKLQHAVQGCSPRCCPRTSSFVHSCYLSNQSRLLLRAWGSAPHHCWYPAFVHAWRFKETAEAARKRCKQELSGQPFRAISCG